ncbi:unnamed protein product [Chrysoparadoxa australica]
MGVEELIPICNRLQDVFSAIGHSPINLPQLVVIGSQSSGKSSVLENIVGRDFLPRGTGIVTRRPLVLQLYNIGNGKKSSRTRENGGPGSPKPPTPEREWGEFLHLPNQKFYNFSEIREEIVRETERVTGSNKGISSKGINLRVYSPHVLNLTLVDLPGITKVALGDQPADIEQQIEKMCLEYIKNPNAIILSVTAANSDLANSDSLKMARKVDPEGDRTIGVLTKLDLMDPGTDASDMLLNRVIPLKRGYVGVINRGQKDIDSGVTIRQALTKEDKFFKEHAGYRQMQHKLGTGMLAKMLNQILMHHIKDCLPEIKGKLSAMMMSVQQELADLGEPTDNVPSGALRQTALSILSKYANNIGAAIDGRGSAPDGIETNELYGGARVSYIFHEIFAQSLDDLSPFDGLTDQDIRTAIHNANGTRPSLFVPEMSFDLLVRRQIARLEQPGIQCCDLVFDEMQRIAAQCESVELTRFPSLKDKVVECVHGLLRKCIKPTQAMVSNLIKLELAYINTSHPDFIGGSKAVTDLVEQNTARDRPRDQRGNFDRSSPPPGNSSNMNGRSSECFAPTRSLFSSQFRMNGNNTSPREGHRQHHSASAVPSHGGKGFTYLYLFYANKGGLMSFIFGGQTPHNQSHAQMVKLRQVPENLPELKEPTDRERVETEIIKSLLESYFAIVRKNFQDMVPKTIMHFLVNEVTRSLSNHLVTCAFDEEGSISDLMRETDDVAERRRIAREMYALLQKAVDILNEVRDFNAH